MPDLSLVVCNLQVIHEINQFTIKYSIEVVSCVADTVVGNTTRTAHFGRQYRFAHDGGPRTSDVLPLVSLVEAANGGPSLLESCFLAGNAHQRIEQSYL